MCTSKLCSWHELWQRGLNTVPGLWSSKSVSQNFFFFFPLCSFLHIPFPLSMGSLAAILKLEHRNTGWTRRTNSSDALWLLGSMLFNTWVLERCAETAFLVINRANAGFHLDYLNIQWYLSVCTALVWSITRSRPVFCFMAVRTLEETAKNSHVVAHRDRLFGFSQIEALTFRFPKIIHLLDVHKYYTGKVAGFKSNAVFGASSKA